MAVNVTTLINNPVTTVFSPFVDLLGTPFYLIPVTVIGVALFIKTKEPIYLGFFLLLSGALLSGGGIFVGAMNMVLLYIFLIAAGFVSVFYGFYFKSR